MFYNLKKNYNSQNFKDIDLNINFEQVSDDTYLKAHKIESPIISNPSSLNNSINLNIYDEDTTINTNLDVYEDLSKTNISTAVQKLFAYLCEKQAPFKKHSCNI